MLAKRFRLQIQNWLKDKNKKISSRKSGFFVVKFSQNNLAYSRFGVIISKKVFQSSVKRNKLKRIIFDFIRLNKLNEIKNNDVVIIVLPTASQLSKEDIEKKLSQIL